MKSIEEIIGEFEVAIVAMEKRNEEISVEIEESRKLLKGDK